MFGHVADRHRSSRGFMLLSFLFAMALAWSFAMQNRGSEPRVSLGTMLAVALGLSSLRVGVMLIGGRRRRRERRAERHADGGTAQTDADEAASGEEPRPTYEDIFGAPAASDGPTDQVQPVGDDEVHEPSGEVETGDGEAHWVSGEVEADHVEADWVSGEVQAGDGDGDHIEAGEGEAHWVSGEVEADHVETDGMSEQLEQPDAEVDEPSVDVEAIRSELESEEAIRRLREEFKARAKEAELRIKERQAELEQAQSAPTSA